MYNLCITRWQTRKRRTQVAVLLNDFSFYKQYRYQLFKKQWLCVRKQRYDVSHVDPPQKVLQKNFLTTFHRSMMRKISSEYMTADAQLWYCFDSKYENKQWIFPENLYMSLKLPCRITYRFLIFISDSTSIIKKGFLVYMQYIYLIIYWILSSTQGCTQVIIVRHHEGLSQTA